MPSVTSTPSDREVIFTRLLDAPVEKAWLVWTDPRHLQQWFGPEGFSLTTHEFAFVPGGIWRFTMHGPNGFDVPNVIVFREIAPPGRLAYDNGWDLPGVPLAFSAVISLVPRDRKTLLSIHMTFASAEAFKTAVEIYGVREGGTQTLGRIASYLESME